MSMKSRTRSPIAALCAAFRWSRGCTLEPAFDGPERVLNSRALVTWRRRRRAGCSLASGLLSATGISGGPPWSAAAGLFFAWQAASPFALTILGSNCTEPSPARIPRSRCACCIAAAHFSVSAFASAYRL
eukprot:3316694-Prymnesium_polylepis.1